MVNAAVLLDVGDIPTAQFEVGALVAVHPVERRGVASGGTEDVADDGAGERWRVLKDERLAHGGRGGARGRRHRGRGRGGGHEHAGEGECGLHGEVCGMWWCGVFVML